MNSIEDSHLKLLTKNKIDVKLLNNENVDKKLLGMKTTTGNSLSGNYLTSILNTIKKQPGSNVTINKSQLSWKRNRSKKSRISAEYMNCIANLLKYAYNYEPENNNPEILSMIDTVIAILFITSTNIKTKDIYEVSLRQFNLLYQGTGNQIVIEGKKVLASPRLTPKAHEKILALLSFKHKNFANIGEKFSYKKQLKIKNYLISTTDTQINRTLKKIHFMLNFSFLTKSEDDETPKSLGLQAFKNLSYDIIYNIISTQV